MNKSFRETLHDAENGISEERLDFYYKNLINNDDTHYYANSDYRYCPPKWNRPKPSR